jgi:putative Holliday junction resolvase
MKILSLDFGLKRIGVAFGDSDITIAFPLCILDNDEHIFDKISQLIQKKQADLILIGLPLTMEGGENNHTQKTRNFAKNLQDHIDIELDFFDERLSTAEARKKTQEKYDDDIAAANFLQTYLEKL